MKIGSRRPGLRIAFRLWTFMVLVGVIPCLAETWQMEKLDDGMMFSGFPDRGFVSDAFGKLHLLVEGNRLVYAQCRENGEWMQEEIAPSTCGEDASMAIDDTGNPHVAFYDPAQRRLCYASRSQFGWSIEFVGDIEPAGRFNSICLDPYGNPIISFLAPHPLHLCLAHLYEQGWDIETIEGMEVFETATSVGVGGDGVINILVETCSEEASIMLIRGWSRDWSFYPVPESEASHFVPVLRVNKNAGPFVIYRTSQFQCAVWQNDHFDIEPISHELIDEYHTTVDLSPAGYLTVCSANEQGSDRLDLVLAIRFNSGWMTVTEEIEHDNSSWSLYRHCADNTSALHITSMTDYVASYLRLDVIRNVFSTCDRQTIVQGYCPWAPCIATQSSDDRIHVAYQREGTDQVMYMVCEKGNWSRENVYQTAPGVSIESVSLTVNPDLQPAICHVDSGCLYLSVKTETGWNREIISATDIIHGQVQFDRDEREHLVYFYRSTSTEVSIGYAARMPNGGWSCEEISRDVQCPDSNSQILAIDEQNHPIVLFKSCAFGREFDLQIAVKQDTGWSIETIGELYTESNDLELIIDAQDNLNILYTFYQGRPGDFQVVYEIRSCSNPSQWIQRYGTIMSRGGSLYVSPSMQWSILGEESGLKHFYGLGETDHRRSRYDIWPVSNGSIDHVLDSGNSVHSAFILNEDDGLYHFRLVPESNGVRLQSPTGIWSDHASLRAYVFHDSLDTIPAALVVAMQFGDRFWFYPAWTEEFHAHPIDLLPARYGAEYTILNHDFTTDTEFHLTFWAALMTPDLSQVIGGDNGIDSIDITCSPW